jgi:hypothetical protein
VDTQAQKLAWDALCDRLDAVGYVSLLPAELVWLNIRWFIDSVQNGGCISYFYNSTGDNLADCRASLQALGAEAQLKALDRVCWLFGNRVPGDIDGRNDIIDSWPDGGHQERILREVDSQLMPQMVQLESVLSQYIEPLVRQSNPSLEGP